MDYGKLKVFSFSDPCQAKHINSTPSLPFFLSKMAPSACTGQQNSISGTLGQTSCKTSQMSPLKIDSQRNLDISLPHHCSRYSVLANMRPLLFWNALGENAHVHWQQLTCIMCILLWDSAHEQLSLCLLRPLPSFRRPAAQGRGCASPAEAASHLLPRLPSAGAQPVTV